MSLFLPVCWAYACFPLSLLPPATIPLSKDQLNSSTLSPQRTQDGAHVLGEIDRFSFLSLALNSPNTADHMGSYGPAFYQSYGASGQFAYEFDGEQLFSVELKKREAVWRLPEFGNFAYFDPQNGLASIAVIKAHLDVLVERSNRTRATNGTGFSSPLPSSPTPIGMGGPRSLFPPHRSQSTLAHLSLSLCDSAPLFSRRL